MARLVTDISRWDEGIDLAAWKYSRGCWGVIIKAGGNEGGRYRDSQFETHYANARALGLKVGVYFYSTETSADDARVDAEYLLGLVSGKSLDLPAYIDVEDPAQPLIGARALTDVCLAFCRRVESAGLRAGVYTSGSWWKSNVHESELAQYSRWVAYWTGSRPSGFSDYELWQQGGMRLADGNVVFDDVPGYVDCNWWYGEEESSGGGGVPSNKLSYALASAEVMDHFVDHDAHGYSQPNRDGTSDVETITLSDGTEVSFQGGDRDCSRLVQTCYVCAGALPRGLHMWTGNERETLLGNGFVEVSLDSLQRGDVLWRVGHTELYMGDGVEAGARRSETHGVDGRTGDQDGGEIDRSDFVRSHWTSAYRCMKERPGEGTATSPSATEHYEEDEMVCILQAGESGKHLYYFDGSRARHVSPTALSGIQKAWQGTHKGGLITVKTLTQEEIDAMCAL